MIDPRRHDGEAKIRVTQGHPGGFRHDSATRPTANSTHGAAIVAPSTRPRARVEVALLEVDPP